ncbi:9340_t:CDS:2 [Gigaspora margarita]|uniref:9340_t:CDS:1 n=1 Tax=Gigaspora margarita TaxID=4874 RepID=A0ABM8W0C4_GIGMA|nr:9340_t:CDS:2 [Gigaspora margarita]
MADILNRKAVEYVIVNPKNAFIEENKDDKAKKLEAEQLKAEQLENGKCQVIRYMIVKLNEEYKTYRKNMKSRQNLLGAQIFLSLIAIFLGELFAFAENSNIIAKIGPQLSSLLGGIATLVTIFTVYLNRTEQKYYESSSVTNLDENMFRLMYLHIATKFIKHYSADLSEEAFYHESKEIKDEDDSNQNYIDKNTQQKLRQSMLYLGIVWFGFIILSKSYDFTEILGQRSSHNSLKFWVNDIELILNGIVIQPQWNIEETPLAYFDIIKINDQYVKDKSSLQ